jgi:hypothetical protein
LRGRYLIDVNFENVIQNISKVHSFGGAAEGRRFSIKYLKEM